MSIRKGTLFLKGNKMTYKEIKENIEKYARKNYKDLIKAIINLESPETSEKTLDEIYEYYMENDGVKLLSNEILEIL